MLRNVSAFSGRNIKRFSALGTCQKSSLALQPGGNSAAQQAVRVLTAGTKLHGYTVEKVEEVPELFMTTVSLNHDKTGAQHLHVARDDNNNTFSVAFRTTPMDSTGVPHILEHIVLCGSQKYPVRDPFFKMLNRSLATFMNAFTASDWTMYPFSTQNRKDYNNLLSIYLDAAFYPQLRELDFSQEGWRLEHEDVADQESHITIKGVVYNEMKGAFSSSETIYMQALQNCLMPSHTYGVISGGNPSKIPDLTWQQLKDFHKLHYHPSNSKFYTYGNFPLTDHLQFINENYLHKFDKISVDTAVPLEKRWSSTQYVSIVGPPDPMAPDQDKQVILSANYLLTDITDVEESTTLSILGALLTEGENSPFYQALLVDNIGSDYSPLTGYQGFTKESMFSVGLQHIHMDDVDTVKKLITMCIDNVIKVGFEQERIDALLHKIELSLKHQTSNFGLDVGMSISSGWIHDGDAAEMLKVSKQVAIFKEKLAADPEYLQKKVRQYFKENTHKLELVMTPDPTYEDKRKLQEIMKAHTCMDRLTDEEKQRIYQLGQELQEKQDMVEDVSCLPTLHLSEMDPQIRAELTEHTTLGDVPIQLCVQPTNEVVYLNMMSYLDDVPQDLKPYIPLFTYIVTKMGAGTLSYKELTHQAELYTGGLSASPYVTPDPTYGNAFDQGVVFSSYCLERNLDNMLELWAQIFHRCNVQDEKRLVTLIKMSAAELAASIPHSGHQYAMNHASSSLSPAYRLNEMFTGISQVTVMKAVAEMEDYSTIINYMVDIGHHILNKNNLKVSVNATPNFMNTALGRVESFIGDLRTTREEGVTYSDTHTTHAYDFNVVQRKTQFEFPFSVNYMSKSVVTVPYTHKDYSTLDVLSQILSWKYLHREIREKGGAYGGGAKSRSGVFNFYSYRDPNSMETMLKFDAAANWAIDGGFGEEDVSEAKLSVFKSLDAPVPPSSVGSVHFYQRITDEMRQTRRDKIFTVTRDDLIDVADRYLGEGRQPTSCTCIGPAQEDIRKNQQWRIVAS